MSHVTKKVPGKNEEFKPCELKNAPSCPVIIPMLVIVVVYSFIVLVSTSVCNAKTSSNLEDHFLKYDDATMLVELRYRTTGVIIPYRDALGFINRDVYDNYLNDKQDEKTIIVYHPYIEGDSITVDSDFIITIRERTYEGFYKDYPPSTYAY